MRLALALAIDTFERAIETARPVPLTDQVRLDYNQLYDLLDATREALIREFGDPRAIHERAPELLVLIDELDTVVHDARRIPLTNSVRFRSRDLRQILDSMRDRIRTV